MKPFVPCGLALVLQPSIFGKVVFKRVKPFWLYGMALEPQPSFGKGVLRGKTPFSLRFGSKATAFFFWESGV